MNMVITDSTGGLISISIGKKETFRELNQRMEKEHGIQMNFSNLQNETRMHLDQNIVTYFSSRQTMNPTNHCSNFHLPEKEVQAYLNETKTERGMKPKISSKEAVKIKAEDRSSVNEDSELQEEFHAVMENIKTEAMEVAEEIETIDVKPEISILSENYEVPRPEQELELSEFVLQSNCRLCAIQHDKMVHIFGPDETYRNIIDMIDNCLPIMVRQTDALPKQVCQFCLEKLELCYKFHKTVEEAEKQLLMLAGKISDESKNAEKNSESSTPCNGQLESKIAEKNPESSTPCDEQLDAVKPTEGVGSDEKTSECKLSPLPLTGNPDFSKREEKITEKNSGKDNVRLVGETSRARNGSGRSNSRNTIKCRICGMFFRTFTSCYIHSKIHASKNHYPCGACDKTLTKKEDAFRHSLGHMLHRMKRRRITAMRGRKISDSDRHSPPITRSQSFSGNTEKITKINYACKDTSLLKETPNDHTYASQGDVYDKVRCRICGEKFETASSCYIHSSIHASRKSYPCSMCDKIFTTEKDSCKHSLEHTVCKIPEKKSNANRIREVRGKKYVRKDGMQCHKMKHNTKVEPCCCQLCDKVMASELSLSQHMIGIHGQRMEFICNTCGKIFRSQLERDVHQGRRKFRPFVCPLCSCRFYTKNHLDLHRLRHCRLSNNYSCSYCGKTYSRKWTLTNHIRIHTGERPFGCSICEKTYMTKRRRDHHQMSHADVGKFKCFFCEKRFCNSARLRQHETIHSEGRLYSSLPKDKLLKATRNRRKNNTSDLHINEKRWQCDTCEKYFLGPSTLRIHNKTQHETN